HIREKTIPNRQPGFFGHKSTLFQKTVASTLSHSFYNILEALAATPKVRPQISWVPQAFENCFYVEVSWLESFGEFARRYGRRNRRTAKRTQRVTDANGFPLAFCSASIKTVPFRRLLTVRSEVTSVGSSDCTRWPIAPAKSRTSS